MAGRPDLYKRNVLPNLDKIPEMALDMTEEQIAKALHVSYTAFRMYKKKHKELQKALAVGRQALCAELKGLLIAKARGGEYEEKLIVKEDGETTKEEIRTKYCPPDTGAIHLLLKNYDPSWADNPQSLKIKREELELKKKVAEAKDW